MNTPTRYLVATVITGMATAAVTGMVWLFAWMIDNQPILLLHVAQGVMAVLILLLLGALVVGLANDLK